MRGSRIRLEVLKGEISNAWRECTTEQGSLQSGLEVLCDNASGWQVRGRTVESLEKVYQSVETPNMTYLGNSKSLGMTAAHGVS